MRTDLRHIRIVNDTGIAHETKITELESGRKIHGVVSIETKMIVGEVVRATVKLVGVCQDVTATGEFEIQHPLTGEWKPIKVIVFADGECWPAIPIREVTSLGSQAREYRKGV